MVLMRRITVVGILLFLSSVATAETVVLPKSVAISAMLVDVEQLFQAIENEHLRILDSRTPAEYAKGHIPGARNVNVAEWKSLAFDDEARWARTVRPLGLQPNGQVVVYGDKLSDTARVWWLLKYVGVEHVSILDGGWEWWAKSGRPIQTAVPTVPATDFKPRFQTNRLEEIDTLKKSLPSEETTVVDTRSDKEFSDGRIPGATHIEWTELVAADGRFKPKKQLQGLFREKGIQPSDTTVCY